MISRKHGFQRQQRMSFEDGLAQLKAQHPELRGWFLPSNNSLPTLDAQLQPVAPVPVPPNLGNRQMDTVANASKACTSTRHIVEQSFARVHDMKMSGNKFPLAHQLTQASGSPPTPDLPTVSVWLDVMAVLRRDAKPYRLSYPLVPGVSYADHGRDLLARLTKENVLCSTKGLQFVRQDIFANVTNRELQNGTVRMANLLDLTQTELPPQTEAQICGILLGHLSKDVTGAYLTSYHEQDVQVLQHGNYVDPDTYHQQASQVSYSNIFQQYQQ